MAFINFGNRIKHRKFDYNPRYYDPEREDLERRLSRYESSEDNPELVKDRIRGGFRKNYRVKDDYTSRTKKRSNKILIFTLLLLLMITYIFLVEYLPPIVARFQ